jgi:hypothetical protein
MEVFARARLVKVFLRMVYNTCKLTETTLGRKRGGHTTEDERLFVSGLTEQVAIQAALPCDRGQLPGV